MPRKPELPARPLREQAVPTSKQERREPERGRKPANQPGLLWDKFRTAPADPA